jgi:ElaB/YqjD/DUF883 family membrane-anchored ribosome-binding protein
VIREEKIEKMTRGDNMAKNNDTHELRKDLYDLRAKLDDMEKSMVHTLDHARYEASEKMKEVSDNTKEKIREKPVESISIAFGTGLLAGIVAKSLMNRRRHN